MTPHDVWAAVARCEKDAVRFARKPGGFSDDRIPVLDEDKVRLAVGPTAWDHVNVKQPEDIWAAGVTGLQATPFTDFTPEFYVTGEKAFVLRMDDVDYLINTEGYDYCRYVARLERPKKAAPAPAPPATSETALRDAAPALLAALMAFVAWDDDIPSEGTRGFEVHQMAHAAIAAATGIKAAEDGLR